MDDLLTFRCHSASLVYNNKILSYSSNDMVCSKYLCESILVNHVFTPLSIIETVF